MNRLYGVSSIFGYGADPHFLFFGVLYSYISNFKGEKK
jgi:hypothetical protein